MELAQPPQHSGAVLHLARRPAAALAIVARTHVESFRTHEQSHERVSLHTAHWPRRCCLFNARLAVLPSLVPRVAFLACRPACLMHSKGLRYLELKATVQERATLWGELMPTQLQVSRLLFPSQGAALATLDSSATP